MVSFVQSAYTPVREQVFQRQPSVKSLLSYKTLISQGKKISSTFKKWKEEICAHTSVLCCMFSFFISNSEALQSPELWTFFLSEIIKRPLNYHVMVILPATCRLQNPVTTLMKGISSWPQPAYTWTIAFRRWLYGLLKEGHHTRPR